MDGKWKPYLFPPGPPADLCLAPGPETSGLGRFCLPLSWVHLNAATCPVHLPDGLPLTVVGRGLSANPLEGFVLSCLCQQQIWARRLAPLTACPALCHHRFSLVSPEEVLKELWSEKEAWCQNWVESSCLLLHKKLRKPHNPVGRNRDSGSPHSTPQPHCSTLADPPRVIEATWWKPPRAVPPALLPSIMC